MKPLVSISCVTFNHVDYIRDCFEGFLSQQTNFSFEILVHDDASTDGTKAIIEAYTEKYPTVFFPICQSENQYSKGVRGLSTKYNIPRVSGKYIAFSDGDDYWTDPFKLQKQVDFLEANPEYVVCSHGYSFKEMGCTALVKKSNPPSQFKINNKGGFDFELNDLCRYPFLFTLTNVVRSDAMKALKIDEQYVYLRDVHINYHLLKEHKKGFYMEESMAVYRIHGGGVHSGLDKRSQDQTRVAICREIYLLNGKSFYSICKLVSAKSILLSTELCSMKGSKSKHFVTIVYIYYLLFVLFFYARGSDFIVYKREHSHMIRSSIRFFASLVFIKI